MVTAQTGMPGVSVAPRFVFGCNGQLNKSLHFSAEKKLVYVAGHNVVLLDLDSSNH